MMTIRKEIHAKSGVTSYTDQRFITNLFRALSSSPTKKFLLFIDQLKNQWIMEEITTSSDIIVKLDKMHKNMVADGLWVTTNEKDTKIVSLTSSFQEIRKKAGELAKRVSFSGEQKGGSGDQKKNGGGKGNATDGGVKTTKTRCHEWQVTKKGSTYIYESTKYSWCPHHHSKDGSVNGLDMPAPHDHDAWAKAKAECVEKFKCGKRDKEGGKAKESDLAKKHKADDKLKLALNDKLTQALVTQHHLSQNEAEELFNKVFQEAKAAQEN